MIPFHKDFDKLDVRYVAIVEPWLFVPKFLQPGILHCLRQVAAEYKRRIASGGMGKPEDLLEVVNECGADAVAMADILHYKRAERGDIRSVAEFAGLGVRNYESV